ncbi:DNA polymerase III subunit alpha [Castellaniella ginsengisoli]|uniref:DNA polymerase III subunit alpha n=1 Tax=Castellaniella ginsengisoli TaxID=546114 RepID=A0AB39D8C0_9BURK
MTTSPDTPLFVHLRSHSEFSVVDGIARIPELIERAREFGQPAMAISDLANLFGWIKFYKTARKAGIKPIAGCDIWLHNPADEDKPFRVLLLASGHAAYLDLCELLARAWTENSQRGRAEIRREWLSGKNGLIVLSGARAGDVGQALEAGREDEARRLARQWAADFPDSYFIELQRAGFDGDEAYVQSALRLAADCGLPVVATHPIQFIAPSDFRAHEARVCIAEGELLGNPRRVRRFTAEQYMPDSADMARRFADVPSALANAVQIARRCNLTLTLGEPQLPLFPTPDGISLDDYLVQLANEGLQRRMVQLYPDADERARRMPDYQERLDLECRTIVDMGFPGYFLIVQDFINWGKSHGVPVGPGRGSGAGSLVAFSLGITDLDPLRYDLLFERFLNPERVSMPDFDVDFCQDNRERVIEYVKEKYGRDAVSQIATFGTLGAKAVVRDVGRVLEMPYSVCDRLSKMIPFNPADPWSLDRTLEHEPVFRELYDTDEEIRALVDLARPLEGLTRNIGMHAGGVLIAPGKLTDFCPLYCQPGSESSVVSQFDKDDVEAAGLVKFDFLGLRNLTILDWAVRYVREFNPDKRDFDLMALPLDDQATYDLLSAANTTAVFQLESRGMKELLKSMRPNTFEDVVALLALFRPGPLESGMVVDFVNRKHGRAEVDYFHPDLEPVLKSTYGVIVYQEQVMLISQIIGGYSLGGADLLRRAMGKKKAEEMAKHRAIFQEGAVKKGYDPDLATHLFDLMEKFAGYGFNKSHSAAYALISYQTAWLKVYHPAEFLAATMLSDMDDTDKVQIFWRDALENGVAVLPPDVNESGYRFAPVADEHTAQGRPPRTIRYGLGGVKGTGQAAVEAIIAARAAGGPFTGLFDFCARVDRHSVNRRTIEALIRAGAFDALEPNRAALLEALSSAIEAAEQAERNANQVSLFDDNTDELVADEVARVTPWDLETRLREEKTALGFYFSGHLFDAWRDEIRRVAPTPLARLAPSRGPQWLAGVLAEVRVRMTRRGKMLYALLDDGSAQVEVAIFNELYEQHRESLKEDRPLVIQGRVSHDDYSGGLRVSADDLYDLQRIRESRARSLRLSVPESLDADRLQALLTPWRSAESSVAVELRLRGPRFSCLLRLGEDWRVRMDETLIAEARQWLSHDNVEVHYG